MNVYVTDCGLCCQRAALSPHAARARSVSLPPLSLRALSPPPLPSIPPARALSLSISLSLSLSLSPCLSVCVSVCVCLCLAGWLAVPVCVCVCLCLCVAVCPRASPSSRWSCRAFCCCTCNSRLPAARRSALPHGILPRRALRASSGASDFSQETACALLESRVTTAQLE